MATNTALAYSVKTWNDDAGDLFACSSYPNGHCNHWSGPFPDLATATAAIDAKEAEDEIRRAAYRAANPPAKRRR